MGSKHFFVLLLLVGGAAFAIGCGTQSDRAHVIELPVRWSTADAKDLETLVETSHAVFLGNVIDLQGQELRALVPQAAQTNATMPVAGKPKVRRSAAELPVSIFRVAVTKEMVGPPLDGEVVLIEQGGGTLEQPDGSLAQVVLEGDQLLQPGETYVFFAVEPTEGSAALRTSPIRRLPIVDEEATIAGYWLGLGAFGELAGLDASAITRRIQTITGEVGN